MAGDLEVDVTSWPTELLEARGSGSNVWRRDPGGGLWLYKATRPARATGVLQGEDWAEKAVERLAALLGVPTARVELATVNRDGRLESGVISKNLAGAGLELQGGATLLADVPGYRYRDSRGRPPRNRVGHSVTTVERQLAGFEVAPPRGFEPAFMTAFDVFGGYLMVDAWIGNQDRHEENWAVLRDARGVLSLAPSFDHGASLGFVLTEAQRTTLARWPRSGDLRCQGSWHALRGLREGAVDGGGCRCLGQEHASGARRLAVQVGGYQRRTLCTRARWSGQNVGRFSYVLRGAVGDQPEEGAR